MKTLFRLWALLALLLVFAACGSTWEDENKEIYPLRFVDTLYEARLSQAEYISFVDGSDDCTVEIAHPDLLDVTLRTDAGFMVVTGKKKGETSITVSDRGAGGKAVIKVRVTDSYIGFVGTGHCNIPRFEGRTCLFLLANEAHDFYLFKCSEAGWFATGEPLLHGQYELIREEAACRLDMTYPSLSGGNETHTFHLKGTDGGVYAVMNRYLGLGWSPLAPGTRDVGPNQYHLCLTEETTGYTGDWIVDFLQMPKGFASWQP